MITLRLKPGENPFTATLKKGGLFYPNSKHLKNKFNCPAKLWRKLSKIQKQIYNAIRDYNKSDVAPGILLSKEAWEMISHNFAYLVASNVFEE